MIIGVQKILIVEDLKLESIKKVVLQLVEREDVKWYFIVFVHKFLN